MFKVFKIKKWFVIVLAFLIVFSVVIGTQSVSKNTSHNAFNFVVAIDAGHGGLDVK